MRDHTGQPLAQLTGAGGRFDGKATGGRAGGAVALINRSTRRIHSQNLFLLAAGP